MHELVLSTGSMARKPAHLDPFNGQVTGLKLGLHGQDVLYEYISTISSSKEIGIVWSDLQWLPITKSKPNNLASINILPWPPWELKTLKTNLLQENLLQYYYSLITNILNILQGKGHREFSRNTFITACRKKEIIQLCHILDYKPRLQSYQTSFFIKKNCTSFKLFSSPPMTRTPSFRNWYWKSVWFNDIDEPFYQMRC